MLVHVASAMMGVGTTFLLSVEGWFGSQPHVIGKKQCEPMKDGAAE